MRMQPEHYWKNDQKKIKIQALNGIRTQDLCVIVAMLYQLSYQSHMVVSRVSHVALMP